MSNIDDNFAKNMIAHHEQINSMANNHVQNGDHPDLKNQAQGIADHAQGVIQNMHSHLAGKTQPKPKSVAERNM